MLSLPYMISFTKISLNKIIFVVFLLLLVATIFRGMYVYYVSKEYYYVVEAFCDSASEKCFERDCSVQDDCPPNGLSIYKKYFIKAHDFATCTDNSCANVCAQTQGICAQIICGADPTDICT